MAGPTTPPEVLARRKRKGWRPDAQGRLMFRPGGLLGRPYVVETAEQLDRIEAYERRKIVAMPVIAGAVLAAAFSLDSDTASVGEAIGMLVVILALVAGLLVYSLLGGSRIVRDTAMRPG